MSDLYKSPDMSREYFLKTNNSEALLVLYNNKEKSIFY